MCYRLNVITNTREVQTATFEQLEPALREFRRAQCARDVFNAFLFADDGKRIASYDALARRFGHNTDLLWVQ